MNRAEFKVRAAEVAADPRYRHPGPGRWWWLSFCDESRPKGRQFLGVAVVEADHLPGAIEQAWRLKINPGGQVASYMLIDRVPVAKWRNRLLSRPECEQAQAEAEKAR